MSAPFSVIVSKNKIIKINMTPEKAMDKDLNTCDFGILRLKMINIPHW